MESTSKQDRHDGVQIRVWLEDKPYSLIREMAAAQHTSVSQIVRDLVSAGMQRNVDIDGVTAPLVDAVTAASTAQVQPLIEQQHTLSSQIAHLERLVFFIAQNTAFSLAATEDGARAQSRRNHPDDAEAAAQSFNSAIGKLQGLAHERINKALKGSRPIIETRQEGINDGTD